MTHCRCTFRLIELQASAQTVISVSLSGREGMTVTHRRCDSPHGRPQRICSQIIRVNKKIEQLLDSKLNHVFYTSNKQVCCQKSISALEPKCDTKTEFGDKEEQ